MNQKLSDWASIAEIISGIAVVVTLVVLILGVRENTEVVRSSVYSDLVRDVNALTADVYRDPELNRIWLSIYREQTDDFSESDVGRAITMVNSQMRNYEKAFYSYQYGVIGGSEWERFQRAMCALYDLGSVFFEAHDVASNREYGALTDEYRAYLSASC